MKKYGKLASVLTVFCLIITVVGCSQYIPPDNYEMAESFIEESYVIDENESYRLSWNAGKNAVWLYDKQTGLSYSNLPQDKTLQSAEKANHPQLESPILIKYLADEGADTQMAVTYNDSIKVKNFKTEKLEKALKITYYFESLEISIPVIYSLREDGLTVTVDADNIKEGKSRIFSVSVMPFTCSVPNNAGDGAYLFIPSGSGALIYPREINGGLPTQYSEEVYGTDPQRYLEVETKETETQSVRMPVYGAWNGTSGIMAVIEEGADSASIDATVGAKNLGYCAVYATFKLRDYQIVKSAVGSKDKQDYVYSKDRRYGKLSVLYHPLGKDEAGYSGMARVYAEYLDKIYGFDEPDEQLYSLKIAGGDMVAENFLGIPLRRLSAMTTLDQSKKMIDELYDITGAAPAVNLIGFGESGLSVGKIAGNYSLGKVFGTKDMLTSLFEYCDESSVPLYMDFDIQAFNRSGAGASTLSTKAVGANLKTVYQYEYSIWSRVRNTDVKKWMLLKRSKTQDAAEMLLESAGSLGVTGICLTSLSSVAYSDFSDTDYYVKANSAEDGQKVYSLFRENGIRTASSSANIYAAVLSEQVFDAPDSSSDYDCFDVSVPFYSMVLKGRVSLSSLPVNITVDSRRTFLKCVETGMGIGFAAAWDYSTEFFRSTVKGLYGLDFEYVGELAGKMTEEYSDLFNAVKGATIKSHMVLKDGLTRTKFSNGVEVTVNFTDEDIVYDNEELEAESFIYTMEGDEN